jgi:8-oxo-dGTP pyrophosphatase MutT (NUDIX family)
MEKRINPNKFNLKSLEGDVIGITLLSYIYKSQNINTPLVIKRGTESLSGQGKYTVPGGKMELSDTNVVSGVQREIKEETGLSIKQSDIIPQQIVYNWEPTEIIPFSLYVHISFVKLPDDVKIPGHTRWLQQKHMEHLYTVSEFALSKELISHSGSIIIT